MTRPARRMCAHCQCSTDEPVLVHEVRAETGPGFNVYACPKCATRYPPLTDVLELLNAIPRPSRMTMRVYKIDGEDTVTEDRSEVEILACSGTEPVPNTSAYPPCGCPRCRARRP